MKMPHLINKHKKLFIYFFLICILFPVNGYASKMRDPFAITITPKENEVLVREPLKLTYKWKNRTRQTHDLSIQSYEFFIFLAYGKEGFKKYRLFYPAEEDIVDRINPEWDINTTLKPTEEFLRSRWVVLGKDAASTARGDWQFLFEKAGTYRIATSYDGENEIIIKVKDVKNKADKQALKLFTNKGVQAFLGETYETRVSLPRLKRIVSRYPKSLYAPYAAIALAKYQWEEKSGFDLDFPTYREALDLVIKKHKQNRSIFEQALIMIIKGFAFQEGGKLKAVYYLKMLQEEFPKSSFIAIAQDDYAIELDSK